MNTIVANVLMSEAAKAERNTQPLNVIVLFCGIGLLASLGVMLLGLDVTGGIS